jgi:hypothetical protein
VVLKVGSCAAPSDMGNCMLSPHVCQGPPRRPAESLTTKSTKRTKTRHGGHRGRRTLCALCASAREKTEMQEHQTALTFVSPRRIAHEDPPRVSKDVGEGLVPSRRNRFAAAARRGGLISIHNLSLRTATCRTEMHPHTMNLDSAVARAWHGRLARDSWARCPCHTSPIR